MTDISVKGLVKSFEKGKNILDGLAFDITEGEHVAILGRNGSGKTTLFGILTGELDFDSGEVSIARGRRMGLISQIPVYPEGYTAEDVLKAAHRRVDALAKRMRELEALMESGGAREELAEYDRAAASFERLGGYDADRMRNTVANGLEIPPKQREQLFATLSGGEKTRINLARLILEDTDILLLDEPTNHLDMRATEWLEDYVRRFRGTVLIISHDRYFLDRTAERCIEITEGKAEFYSGNYSFYAEERQRRFDEKMKQYEKNAAKAEQLEKAAERQRVWAFMGNDKRFKQAKVMERRAEKLRQEAHRPKKERELKSRFEEREFGGDEVLLLRDVAKSFDGKELFKEVSARVEPGERIALLGDNGAGKTTLLKLILGDEQPDEGRIRLGPSVKPAYLPQIVRFENEGRSMRDMMLWECKCAPQEARDRLAAFGFTGEDVFKEVRVLSGGEKSRLKLCMLMGRAMNFLLLDEPTNHLDIASREWIEGAIAAYGGTLLFVSHDRYFIDSFATRIWSLEGGRITDFEGGFHEFQEYRERMRSIAAALPGEPPKKAARRERTDPKTLEKKLSKLERDIGKFESELAALAAEAEKFSSDYEKLMELDERKAELISALEPLYAEWGELAESASE